MEVLVLFIMIISLLLIGVPIAVSLGLSSMIFLLVMSDTSLESIAQSLYQAMAGHYTLLAIPFFILASSFMSTGGVAQRIIRFAIACVGHLQGGLAIAGWFNQTRDRNCEWQPTISSSRHGTKTSRGWLDGYFM